MITTSTADTLHRHLVLPVRATRARLGAAADYDPAVVARHTAAVAPALAAAAERVATRRDRLAERAARADKRSGTAALRRHRRGAFDAALGTVDGIHADLTKAADDIDR